MTQDPYRFSAKFYDRLFDSMNKGLRLAGIRMYQPAPGMSILDVGCGTGSHLELYLPYKCELYGLDSSPSMLEIARKRLQNQATLDLGDANAMRYPDNSFNLIISMLTIHEMSPDTRDKVIEEMIRVLKPEGRILLIDFHTGRPKPLQGWISKTIITLSEIAAGGEHYRNYRQFMSSHGLETLVTKHQLVVDKERILAGGTFANYLLIQ